MAHIVHDPRKQIDEYYDLEEPCPECGEYIPVYVDIDLLDDLEITCPVCGYKMMICATCDSPCDWNEKTGCCKKHKD